ncbi:YicC/YloC family endoribonuclease [uncultured Allofournierella sp.]|uniref:YicC/YloC family endoribonuclease n=1 Tax=uncultured Allofournierella sp. TaxID=1940258 RepID=UPI003753CBB2
MALSMTGYGRGEAVVNGRSITIEIKSVNSRYFEYFSRIPRSAAFLDDKLKQQLAQQISRGKTELHMQIQNVSAASTQVEVDLPLARQYAQAMAQISQELGVKNDVTAGMLSRCPDVLVLRQPQVDEEQLWQDVSGVCQQALERFVAMRTQEGQKLKEDILSRLDTIEANVQRIEQESEGRVEAYTQRLYARLQTLLQDHTVEESRLLTEAAIFADKTAVDEETVRLRSHLAQYRQILTGEGPVGRKLDFLTQELNRETNTIGSKCQDIAITRIVVDTKAEIEKIREQIQNIE